MEFKSLTNIESSFRRIRLMLATFVCCCTLITGYSLWSSYSFAEKQREKIYVLDGGKSLMLALSQDLSQNRPAEAREHVRRFHELFFTLSPEKSAIEHNVKRALLLADKSVYHYYSDFAEKGYYNRIIAGNINQVLKVCRQNKGYWREEFFRRHDPRGREYFWLTGAIVNSEPESTDTDEWALANGYVSVVPVQTDMTDYAQMSPLERVLV